MTGPLYLTSALTLRYCACQQAGGWYYTRLYELRGYVRVGHRIHAVHCGSERGTLVGTVRYLEYISTIATIVEMVVTGTG